MAEARSNDERSWLPLALAGGFVVFAVGLALFAYAGNSDGDPSRAKTVYDVAELTVESVEDNDPTMYDDVQCGAPDTLIAPYVGGDSTASANHSAVSGEQTGSFHLTIEGEESAEFDVTVGRVEGRSCIEAVELIEATR